MLGYVQFAQEDYTGAAASFEKAVALRGDWSEARWNLALAYVRLGQYQDAARHLQVYLSLAGSEAERREAQRLLGELGQYR
jgi:Flp pilus assembly protein TadD